MKIHVVDIYDCGKVTSQTFWSGPFKGREGERIKRMVWIQLSEEDVHELQQAKRHSMMVTDYQAGSPADEAIVKAVAERLADGEGMDVTDFRRQTSAGRFIIRQSDN